MQTNQIKQFLYTIVTSSAHKTRFLTDQFIPKYLFLRQIRIMISNVVEARCGQTHLGTCFVISHRLDTSRHFLANLFVILDQISHLNYTDCFGDKDFALDSNDNLQTLSKLFLPHQLLYTWTRITNFVLPMVPANKSLDTF